MSYSLRHDPAVKPLPWIVVDAAGSLALWRQDPKLGKVPLRFGPPACSETLSLIALTLAAHLHIA